jgi:ATP-binding cassette subfamily C (CFTR/MRP) protein 1
MVTIAHRIDTIIGYDYIVVMTDGRVSEFDTPTALMSNSESHFAQLVKASGKDFSSNQA